MEDGMDLSDGEEEPLPQAPSFQKPPSQIQGLPVRPREELTTYGYTYGTKNIFLLLLLLLHLRSSCRLPSWWGPPFCGPLKFCSWPTCPGSFPSWLYSLDTRRGSLLCHPNAQEVCLKGLASYCKAETTFTFYFSILTMSNAFLGIDNREMKSESGFSFAIASQPLCTAHWHQNKHFCSSLLWICQLRCKKLWDNTTIQSHPLQDHLPCSWYRDDLFQSCSHVTVDSAAQQEENSSHCQCASWQGSTLINVPYINDIYIILVLEHHSWC